MSRSEDANPSWCCCLDGRHLKEARNAYDTQHKLHTFSVGVPNSPDLIAARKVKMRCVC